MKNFITSLFLLFSAMAFAQTSDCASVHNGKFIAAESSAIKITRDSTTQTEYNGLDGTYVKMSVEWTGECTYVLRYLDSDKKGEKKTWKKLQYLTVNITEVTSEGYSYTCSSPGLPADVRGKMLKK